jgi:hypothetical protein
VHELVHSCAGCERMMKTQSCQTLGKREGIVASHLFLGGPFRPILRYYSAGRWLGSAEMIVARRSFRGNAFRTVQELHLWQRCRKYEYPANTEHNVTPRIGLRTKMVSWWRKLNQPALSTRVRDETAETPRETGARNREGRKNT